MSPSTTLAPSAPFAHREFNGELLLEELRDLRAAGVGNRHMVECALALREVRGQPLADALIRIKQIATLRFGGVPELSGLLTRWSAKLKTERDVSELILHFQRIAIVSGLIGAIGRGVALLPRGGRR
jgi:hypothetical protein